MWYIGTSETNQKEVVVVRCVQLQKDMRLKIKWIIFDATEVSQNVNLLISLQHVHFKVDLISHFCHWELKYTSQAFICLKSVYLKNTVINKLSSINIFSPI